MTVGAGASGLAAPEISAIALPGNDFNLGLGAVNQLFGLELGFHSGLFTFNPDAIRLDVVLLGVSTDLKLQPSLGIFEPFVSAGIGAYNLHDTFLAESALGGSGRLAAGIDVRIAKFALSLRYQRNFYHFFNERSYYDGLDAQTESVGLNLSFYL